jgi:hypothetical protein
MHAFRICGCAFLVGIALTTAVARAAIDDGDDNAGDGQKVHRCAGRYGEIVFSGLPCAATDSAAALSTAGALTAPPAADSCPASREELRDRVVAAIARHDPNALAGMLRWRGVGAQAADSRLRTLRELTRHALLAIDSGDDATSSDSAGTADASGGFRIRTGGGESGGVHEHVFGVSTESGCYWLVW